MAIYFIIKGIEVGGTKSGQLQYLNNGSWVDLGAWTTTSGVIMINPLVNPIEVDYSLFNAGQTYSFRFIDNDGILISAPFDYTFGVISAYTSGISTIPFTYLGSNSWNAQFLATPTSNQVPSGVSLASCDYTLNFWTGKALTNISAGTITVNTDVPTGANGAGVYELLAIYRYSDLTYFSVKGLVLVDSTDNILASLYMRGITVNSVNGLAIDLSANLTQVGCSYVPNWGAFDAGNNPTLLGSGLSIATTIPPTSVSIASYIDLDSLFLTDFDGDNVIQSVVIIN